MHGPRLAPRTVSLIQKMIRVTGNVKATAACPADLWYRAVMERDAAIATLKAHEAELKKLGVEHLYLFGSTARDEARDDSDVDLFFDYEKGKLGLFELMDVQERATSILGRKADIMTRDSLHKTLRQRIEAGAVPVF
jgi:predicted nucleotidyltransferase